MEFFKKKKVFIPLIVIVLFHVINFFYYTIGKNDIEGYWHAEVVNEQIGDHYFIVIYQLDQSAEYKGKEYQFIILGTEKRNQKKNPLIGTTMEEKLIIGLAKEKNTGQGLIDNFGKTIKLIDKNKMIWNGITYIKDDSSNTFF